MVWSISRYRRDKGVSTPIQKARPSFSGELKLTRPSEPRVRSQLTISCVGKARHDGAGPVRTGPPTTFPSVAHPGNATNFPPSRATTESLVRRFPGAAQLFPRLGAREVKGRKGPAGPAPPHRRRPRETGGRGMLAARGDGGGSNGSAAGVRAADRGSVCGVDKEAVLTPQSFSGQGELTGSGNVSDFYRHKRPTTSFLTLWN